MSVIELPLRNPGQHSDDELYDILAHMDRDAHPDRYQVLRDEYVRRHGDRVNGKAVDAYFARTRRARPVAERSRFKRRVLIALAVWSLVMLAIRALVYLSSHQHVP
jgi:hypothetical protein